LSAMDSIWSWSEDFMNVYSVNVFGAALMAKYAANLLRTELWE